MQLGANFEHWSSYLIGIAKINTPKLTVNLISSASQCLAVWLFSLVVFSVSVSGQTVQALGPELAEEYHLDADFYKKVTMVEDILIATSGKVTDYTHLEAAYLFKKMMNALRPDIAERIRGQKVLCILVGHDELTSDIPQFKSDKTGKELDYYNWRSRGFLSKADGRYVVLFAEEDVMEYEGGMLNESILIHEFGHVIHGAGFDEELDKKWTATYEASMEAKRWNDGYASQRFRRVTGDEPELLLEALLKSFPDQPEELLKKCLNGGNITVNGEAVNDQVKVTGEDDVRIDFGGEKDCYATKNRAEFLAEGVQCWFNTNRTMDHDHNHIHTREQLKAYDPDLAAFCEELFGDSEWRFVPVRERAGEGHLEGYDPKTAPVVKTKEHIRIAGLDYYDKYWKDYWKRLSDKYSVE